MSVLKFASLALCLGFVSLTVRSVSKEYSVFVSIAAAVVLISLIIVKATGIYSTILSMFDGIEEQRKILLSCGKMISIAYVAEFSANLLESADEKNIADKMRLFGKLAIFSSCIPLLTDFSEMIFGLL